MAKIIKPPYFESVVNAGEKRLLDFLEINLPEDYYLIPNVEIASTNPRNNRTQYWEYDLVVVAPHAIYNIENKDWKGRIEGDDNYWYVNDRQKPNPLKTNRQKTAILASKLKEANFSWGKAWVHNLVTLSYSNSIPPLLWQEAGKLTFELKDGLINFITNPDNTGNYKNTINEIQKEIVDFLIGAQSQKSPEDKKIVNGHEVIEILQQEPNFTEYLVKPKGVTSSIRKTIKEYALQVAGLSPEELRKREQTIKNQYKALNKIKANPFILNVEFYVDEENHLFYETSDFLYENSLRAEANKKTFTFQQKIDIIKNIMSAIKEAHSQNIYHRDINPDNIYISNGYAYLSNFGKSYFTDHNEQGYTVMATINEMNATPFHPLELTIGDASEASDMYSLGVLIYWLFTDEVPFKTPYDLDKLGGTLPDNLLPSALNSNLPNWIDEVCSKTILVDDLKRIASIEVLETIIEKALTPQNSNVVVENPTTNTTPYSNTLDLKEGDRVGDFIIFKTLGKGGYSKVFKVKHSLQGQEYALKLFHQSVNVSSVLDEYNALIDLDHPNIVKFKWNGTADTGQFYTLTEYLDGEDLSLFINTDTSLPIKRVYQVAENILEALVLMQSQPRPIFHRDIKPQNIIWDNKERFVLIDFNVASFAEENKDFVGTNPYLAPDLIAENYRVNWDKSADVFALGITLFELACKQYPWAPKKIPIRSIPSTSPKEIEPKLSIEFSNFLLKAISTDTSVRFSSAAEMLSALREIGVDNTLQEKKETETEVSNDDHLYHTEIYITQAGFQIRLYDKMDKYVNIKESINDALERFHSNLKKYKTSISLDKEIRVLIKVDSKSIISQVFWKGGAKTFTEGNVDKVYNALKNVFNENQEKIKAFKLSVEGLNIVEYINSLYSQSKYGNSGTRASSSISEFDKITYSPSKLDRKLIPDILDGRFKLLIITGNAGDGKTAFIRKIEEDNSIKDIEQFKNKNGARFKINGTWYESNYDGSQDEDDKANDDVLETFFKPFENNNNYNNAEEGRIIAINEGRLVEFLSTSSKYNQLTETIEEFFYKEGHHNLPDGLMIINLNLRSIVAQDEKESSLFRKQIKALTKKELWTKCEGCSISNKCFIKYNVDSFNDSSAGEDLITRMEWLLRTASLKRELHITIRDLRSLIAFTLTRDFECDEVEQLYNSTVSSPENYWKYFYFNITNPSLDDSGNQDRLIKLLRETDIGEVAIPDLDRDLFFSRHKAKSYLEFAERKINLLESFNNNKIYIPAHELSSERIEQIKSIQKNFIRHQYFEGKIEFKEVQSGKEGNSKMPSYLLRLPYHSVFNFFRVLEKRNGNDDYTKKSISRAISLNEGCDNKGIDTKYLVLQSSEVKDPFSFSYRLFSLEDFELFVNRTSHLVNYLEYEPDSLTFRHRKEKHIKLTISLDLYEMLYFIQQGFSPSLNDLKGKFIELVIFKNLLKNLTYNEVIVTKDNLEFYKISKNYQSQLQIQPMDI